MSSAQARDDRYMVTGLTTTSLQTETTYSPAATAQSYTNQQSYTPSGTPTPQQMGSAVAAGQAYSSPYSNQPVYPGGSASSIPSVPDPASGTQPSPHSTHLTYPTSAGQPAYPTSATQVAYPTSATQSAYPVSTQPSTSNTYQSGPSSSYAPGIQLSYQTGTTPATNDLQSYSSEAHSYYPGGTSMTGTGAYQAYSTGTAGANASQLYQTGSETSITDPNAGAVGYGAYSNYYPQGYTQYPASSSQPQVQEQPTPVVQSKTKESNIDLLSGLDFTISQAPLIPQQNIPKIEASEIKPPVTSENKASVTKIVPSKEEKPAPEIKRLTAKILPSKQLNNNDVKNLFKQEIEKYEKYVETLTNKTLSGPTNLDIKWKEIQDKQDAEGQRRIISVARCYPMKNRFPDILPYDYSRVELYGTKDDYINASYIYVSTHLLFISQKQRFLFLLGCLSLRTFIHSDSDTDTINLRRFLDDDKRTTG